MNMTLNMYLITTTYAWGVKETRRVYASNSGEALAQHEPPKGVVSIDVEMLNVPTDEE